jgi:DNA repair ATPase RecN
MWDLYFHGDKVINSLDVRNFQSLRAVHLDLGPLTVIVGDSNCGKSALVRSIQALASNVRGSTIVTHGYKLASISAVTDSATVTFVKGEGHGYYRIVDQVEEREFTKLAGEVPIEISRALELDAVKEGLSLNFAPQHEPPFLLTSSGSVVARTLGELTKVSTVLEAVREANRRRTSSSGDLKLRSKDLESVKGSMAVVDQLSARRDAIYEVEKILLDINGIESEIFDLESAVDCLDKADIEVSEVYDISDLVKAFEDFTKMYKDLEILHKLTIEVTACDNFYENWRERSDTLEKEFHEALEEAGECPLCGQMIL